MRSGRPVTLWTLFTAFRGPVLLTWLLTLTETAMMALVTLFIGFAIDGFLASDITPFFHLATLLAGLIAVAVLRRLYDTRAYGSMRVRVGRVLARRLRGIPVSALNARLDMGRELVDFLEFQMPEILESAVQLVVALIILFLFHPVLCGSAVAVTAAMLFLYALVHGRFHRLNGQLNQQTEQQVRLLEAGSPHRLMGHLLRLRRIEIRLSDTEAWIYGGIFALLMTMSLFNLWFAASHTEVTAGRIFAIISYS